MNIDITPTKLNRSITIGHSPSSSTIIDEDNIIESPTKRVAKLDRYGFVVNNSTIEEQVQQLQFEESPDQIDQRQINEKQWNKLILNWNENMTNNPGVILELTSRGIPMYLRTIVWRKMLNIKYYKDQYPPNYFSDLCKRPSNEHTEQILLDVPRTFPNNKRFFTKRGKRDLLDVLQCYSYHNETVGYCQGMSYLAGVFLMYHTKEDSFWMLVALLEREHMVGYFISGMPRLISDSQLFQKVLEMDNNTLASHLKINGIDPLLYVTPWWMCFFTTLVDWSMILRIWDLIMFEGVKSLFRISLAIVNSSESRLMVKKGAEGLLPFLLRPPLEEVGGIDNILKMAIDFPISDLMVEAQSKLDIEKINLSAQKNNNKANQTLNTKKNGTLNNNNNNTLNHSNESIFGRILNMVTTIDDNQSPKNSVGDFELKEFKQRKPTPPQSTASSVSSSLESRSLSNRMKDFSMKFKNRFMNRGYQPCRVILEQRQIINVGGRKSIARKSIARPSIRPSIKTPGGRKSIVPRLSTMGRPSISANGRISIAPRKSIVSTNARKSLARKSIIARPTPVANNDLFPNTNGANSGLFVGGARKSIKPSRATISKTKAMEQAPVKLKITGSGFQPLETHEEDHIPSDPMLIGTPSAPITKNPSTANRPKASTISTSSPYASPSKQLPTSPPIQIPKPSRQSFAPYSPQSIKIGPPPVSSAPILKILSPCTNSNSSNNLLNIFNNSTLATNSTSSNSNSNLITTSSSTVSNVTPIGSSTNSNISCSITSNSNSFTNTSDFDMSAPIQSPFKKLKTFDSMMDIDNENGFIQFYSHNSSSTISPLPTPTKEQRKHLLQTTPTKRDLTTSNYNNISGGQYVQRKPVVPMSYLSPKKVSPVNNTNKSINTNHHVENNNHNVTSSIPIKKGRPQANFWYPMGI